MKKSYAIERPCGAVIETLDGRAYVGETVAAALDMMRQSAWGCPGKASIKTYRDAVARRVLQWNKCFVRTDSNESFLADLESAGIITIRSVQ